MGSSTRFGNRGEPSHFGGSSDFMRRTMTASSCLRSGVVPRANRWLSSSSSRRRKALRVAVVRRGREEQLVFKVRRQQPERLRPQRVGGVPAHARMGHSCGPRPRSACRTCGGKAGSSGPGSSSRNSRSGRSRLRKSMLVMSRGKWVHGLTWMPRLRRSIPHQRWNPRCGSRGRTCPACSTTFAFPLPVASTLNVTRHGRACNVGLDGNRTVERR